MWHIWNYVILLNSTISRAYYNNLHEIRINVVTIDRFILNFMSYIKKILFYHCMATTDIHYKNVPVPFAGKLHRCCQTGDHSRKSISRQMRREVWKNQGLMRGDWLRNDDELRRRATVRRAASVNDADAVNQHRSRRTPSAAEQVDNSTFTQLHLPYYVRPRFRFTHVSGTLAGCRLLWPRPGGGH